VKRPKDDLLAIVPDRMSVIVINPYRFGGGATYTASASHFSSAAPDYLAKTGQIYGAASKQLLASFFLRLTARDGETHTILHSGEGLHSVRRHTDNTLIVEFYNAGIVRVMRMRSTATVTADGQYHHLMCAVDTSTDGNNRLLIDGVEGFVLNTRIDSAIHFAASSWLVSRTVGSVAMDADISELYFAPGQWLDLTVAANVAKFRDPATGKPVSLGADGSLPTGTAPAIYLKNPYSSFGTNSGTGGDFTVYGTLTEATPP
jgi:hypothetical protein